MKCIVATDVDGTALDRIDIQDFFKSLSKRPYVEKWIVTTRHEEKCSQGFSVDNTDVYELAETIEVSHNHIFFTEMEWKYIFYKAQYKKGNFVLWHIDDLPLELMYLAEHTKTTGFHVNTPNLFKRAGDMIENWYYSYIV
jgi:hypothetical protein